MPSMNVSLTPELMKIVQSKVKSGLYNNSSEVIREAIRQLDLTGELLYTLQMEQLRKALAPGMAQADAKEYAEYSLDSLLSSPTKTKR